MVENPTEMEPLEVRYSRSPTFKTVHGDGVIGGPSPRGLIRMAVYNERSNLPQVSVLKSADKDNPVSEEFTKHDKGVEREFQVDVSFDFATAVSVGYWLIKQADTFRKQANVPDAVWDQLLKASGQ